MSQIYNSLSVTTGPLKLFSNSCNNSTFRYSFKIYIIKSYLLKTAS
jgi:hypothetical protein